MPVPLSFAPAEGLGGELGQGKWEWVIRLWFANLQG